MHASSGSAYSYLGLARRLGPDRPVFGIEAPGFDGEREPVRSVPALSAEYAGTLRAARPDGDLLLLGWSLGGVIALDVARRLTAAGVRVRRVVMVDVSVPRIVDLPPEAAIADRFLREMLATVGAPPPTPPPAPPPDAAAPGPPDAGAVFAAAERSGALPPELDAELLTERYPVFRALVEASYRFEVTEPYHGPVVHLAAADSDRGELRWDPLVTDLTEQVVPGDHHSIWSADGLPALAELVRAALDDPAE